MIWPFRRLQRNRQLSKQFDPFKDYGLLDLKKDENLILWKYGELLKTLITLSENAVKQIDIIGCGIATDEMAQEFEIYYTSNSHIFINHGFINQEIKDRLDKLDYFFDERSGGKAPDFWDEDTLDTHPDWQYIRTEAKAILKLMNRDYLTIVFEREERKEIGPNGRERLVFQSTRTRLIEKQ